MEIKKDNKSKYMALNIRFRMVEDSYEEGENPNDEHYWDTTQRFEGDTIQDVVNKVAKEYGFDAKDAYVFDDIIAIEMMVDRNVCELSKEEEEMWRKGKFKAYNYEVRFDVIAMQRINHDELVACGYESCS